MSKNMKIIIALVAVMVIAGLAIVLMPKNNKNESAPAPSSSNNTTNDDTSGQSAQQEADVTVTYTGSGFSLSATTVKSGGTVKVVNESTKNLEFESDPHPAHTDNSELNAGTIAPGKSSIFTLTKKGSWGFHNHLNASHKGELTVQ